MTTSYRIDPSTDERIENIFKHHPPFGNQLERYNVIREQAKAFAYLIVSLTPTSDEQLRSLEHLDEVVTCANSAIARHEKFDLEIQQPPRAKFSGCYGGHDPNELPDESEEAGGDPLGRPITKPGVEPQYDPIPLLEVQGGGSRSERTRTGNVIPA